MSKNDDYYEDDDYYDEDPYDDDYYDDEDEDDIPSLATVRQWEDEAYRKYAQNPEDEDPSSYLYFKSMREEMESRGMS